MIYFQRKLSRLCCYSLSERTDVLVNALVELWEDMIYFQRKLSRLCCHSLSERTDALVNALVELWDASVRASHHFLAEEDIRRLIPFVGEAIQGVETLLAVDRWLSWELRTGR